MSRLVSDCCGVRPKVYLGPHGTPDCDDQDFGRCGECEECCNYITEEEYVSLQISNTVPKTKREGGVSDTEGQ